MADYSSIISVLQLLSSFITDEINLLRSLPGEVKSLTEYLNIISGVLKTADKSAAADRNDLLNDWINKVRALAFEIEDIIEEYLHLQKREWLHLRSKHELAKKIETTHKKARDLTEQRKLVKFCLKILRQEQSSSSTHHHANPSSDRIGSYLVGACHIHELKERLQLLDMESPLSIVPVVGRQGVGKTTLVRSFYYDDEVRELFSARAWISIAESRSYAEILSKMVPQLHESTLQHDRQASTAWGNYNDTSNRSDPRHYNESQEEELQYQVSSYLEKRRFMLVFDDVREEAIGLAEKVKSLLMGFKPKGSKVVIITSNEDVAHDWGFDHVQYRLETLTFEAALELFYCKATPSRRGDQLEEQLKVCAEEIVKKSEGVPSLVKEFGEILCNEEVDLPKWRKVSRNPWFYVRESYSHTSSHNNLVQSYYGLASDTKPCFLYFGLFPENYAIERMRLIRLWIGEGFVRNTPGSTLEQVAENHLDVLIKEGLVTVQHTDITGKTLAVGVARKYVYDLIVSIVEDSNFGQNLSTRSRDSAVCRRLSIQNEHDANIASEVLGQMATSKSLSSIRSFLSVVEPSQGIIPKILTGGLLKKNHLLKVLDLENAPIQQVPDGTDELLNLTYLSLKNTPVETLPDSIGKLRSLETLNLKHTYISELPHGIHHLVKLRHLLAYHYSFDPSISKHVSATAGVSVPHHALEKFTQLQKLAYLDVSHMSKVKELRHLKQLRKLGIVGMNMGNEDQICYAIQIMDDLEVLSLQSVLNDTTMNLEHINRPPQQLKRLYLSGRLMKFPSWLSGLDSLVKLRLRWSRLNVDPLQILQSLNNLLELQLLAAYEGATLEVGREGFRKLKVLNLLQLRNLQTFSIRGGALPLVEVLSIGECQSLELPCGFEYLSSLKKLLFYDMPTQFIDSFKFGGKYFNTMEHETHVNSYVWSSQGWQLSFTLRDIQQQ